MLKYYSCCDSVQYRYDARCRSVEVIICHLCVVGCLCRLMKEAVKLVDKCMFLNVLLETKSSAILSTYDSFLISCCHCNICQSSLDFCHPEMTFHMRMGLCSSYYVVCKARFPLAELTTCQLG